MVVKEVEARQEELIELSLRIHQNPELGFHEVKASGWLTEYLERNGFRVEKGICQLATAFKGSYGSGKPAIALLAEYDALPKLGHACGHNIISTAAVGAAVALRGAIDKVGGNVVVIGTPAEELYGGKVIMAERGAFDDLDAAMIVHPSVVDVASIQALACIGLEVEFWGKAAHAAAYPQEGVNALEAMIQAFNGINSLRQHIRERARIHGIITQGGEAPNVVPVYTAGSFLVRAEDEAYLDELKEKVLNCFNAASLATGARLEYKWADVCYAPLKTNFALAEVFSRNMEALGRNLCPALNKGFGSSDVGNVSALVPTIHPEVAIAPMDVLPHSPEFAAAAASEGGNRGLLDGAKALAMTAVDLITQPEIMGRIKEEFFAAK
ncbi:MAG: M20 family metallopeptidase [Dehalococcoidia bacterium]|nr:M20 family metallopeptidase [Dehalococcoidia bacterium]